jgi:ketosteroid isomerase-like protein
LLCPFSPKESKMTEHLDVFLSDWTGAERAGDTEKLATLLTDDFYGVGPLGFVLPKPAWLARHGQGLAYEAFDLDEIQVHLHCDLALVTARNNTRGTYRGQSLPEATRATLVVAADSDPLRLAAIHMSFIAGTHGSPPVPSAANAAGRGGQAARNGGNHTDGDWDAR